MTADALFCRSRGHEGSPQTAEPRFKTQDERFVKTRMPPGAFQMPWIWDALRHMPTGKAPDWAPRHDRLEIGTYWDNPERPRQPRAPLH